MPGGGNKRGRKRAEGEQEEEFDMAFVDEDVEMVDVDFAFFEPFESDFHGVRALLQKAFEFCKRAPILDISEIADVACNQGNIGTVLKSGDEEGLFGIYTAVNLRQYKASFAQSLTGFVSFLARFGGAELCTCIESLEEMETATGTTTKNSSSSKRIDHAAPVPSIAQPTSGGNKASCSTSSKTASSRKHSLSVTDLVGAGDGSVAGKVAAWIENKNVGLLINERIINLPEEVALPLHKALQEGIEWSQSTPECPEDERPFYFFDYFVGVAKCFEDHDGMAFANYEEEIYLRHAVYRKAIKLLQAFPNKGGGSPATSSGESCEDDASQVRENEHRVIYVIRAVDLPKIVGEIENYRPVMAVGRGGG